MLTFYGTFPANHDLGSAYVEIKAKTELDANILMDATYQVWSMVYSEENFKSNYFPRGKIATLE